MLRPRFVEILNQNQTWYEEPKYEEVDYYQRQGARRKDNQGREQVAHRDPTQPERAPQAFRRQSTQTDEQWETIRSVAETMSHGMPNQGQSGAPKSPSQHQYEKVPRSLHQDVRVPRQHQYRQDQRSLHQNVGVPRLDPERVMPRENYYEPPATSTPQKQNEARAMPQNFGSPLVDGWEREMLRNINAISVTGGMTRLQSESFLLKEQELKRQEIQQQLAHIQSLNKTINLEVGGSDHSSLEDDREIDDMQNVICSTDPGLLSSNYATRLEIMKTVQEDLNRVLIRKSRRLQQVQAEQVDTRGLPERERKNLQY